jgi:hypothetical protein
MIQELVLRKIEDGFVHNGEGCFVDANALTGNLKRYAYAIATNACVLNSLF